MDLQSMMAAEGGGAPPAGPSDDGKILNLGPKIETQACYAKNVDTRFPMTNLFIGDSRLGCKSDADEQLILHISFQEFVKVCCTICRGCFLPIYLFIWLFSFVEDWLVDWVVGALPPVGSIFLLEA